MSEEPKFTVALPVHDGIDYIAKCVGSVLSQNYTNFELVILENKSTDGTAQWLKDIVDSDVRIKLYESDQLLSIEDNWKRILEVPKMEFLTIIGHDDIFENNFLETISKTIMAEPDCDLYSTHFNLIDENGSLIRPCKPIPKYESSSAYLASRFAEIRDSFGTGHVIRSKRFDDIGGIPSFDNLLYADDALWISMIGKKERITSSEFCFSYRLHESSVSGSPCPIALFNGLKKFMVYLQNVSENDKDLQRVIEIYGPSFFTLRCKIFFSFITKSKGISENEKLKYIEDIKSILETIDNLSYDKNTTRMIKKIMQIDQVDYSCSSPFCKKLVEMIKRVL